jgi:hypothetical protein
LMECWWSIDVVDCDTFKWVPHSPLGPSSQSPACVLLCHPSLHSFKNSFFPALSHAFSPFFDKAIANLHVLYSRFAFQGSGWRMLSHWCPNGPGLLPTRFPVWGKCQCSFPPYIGQCTQTSCCFECHWLPCFP